MNRNLYLVLFLLVSATSLFAQNCVPLTNPSAGPDCFSAPFLCCGEVDGFSGTTPPIVNPSDPNPLCPGGGQPNNMEWISFAAGSTAITLHVNLLNCTDNGQGPGAQVGVYPDCNFNTPVFCNSNQNNGLLIIPLNGLTIGNVYHIFIDGWSGSVCDYDFTVVSGNTFAPEPMSPPTITNPNNITSLCPGAGSQTFNAGLGVNSSFNLWDVTPALPFIDNGTSITITDWTAAEGQNVQICVTGLNDCYMDPTGYIPTCYNVMVSSDLQMNAMGSFCQADGGYDFPEDNLPTLYGVGTHIINVPNPSAGQGCEIEYTLDVQALLPENLDSNIVLCPGIPWINQTTGQAYFPNPGGPIFLPLPYGVGLNGCPRIINLQLAQVDTSAQIIASPGTQLDCDNPNIILTANVNFDPQVTYTYEWDTFDGSTIGSTSQQTLIVNGPGTYTLMVTMETSDDRGIVICNSTPTSITITEDTSGPDVSVTAQTPSSCGSIGNGTATVNPSGGVSPYTFQWDALANNQTLQTATGLLPGTYFVTVLDNTLCESVTSVTVLGTAPVTIDIDPSIVNVLCSGDLTGSATVSASGGTGTITYTWGPNAGGQSGPTATGLGAGTVTVTAEDDLGCTADTTLMITEPLDVVSGTVGTITASACGLATGTIDITPAGGVPPYTYLWSDLAGTTDQDLSGAAAGSYQVTVFDDNLCTVVLSGSIPNADGPSIDLLAVTDAGCLGEDNGSINLTYSGGTGPYVIEWDVPPGQTPIPNNEENPTGLIAGNYNVTITDVNMCEVTGTETVGEPALLTAAATATPSNCNQATGDITLTINGGSTVSTYLWDNGAPPVQDPQDQAAGTYNVTVTDVNGCVALATVDILSEAEPVGTSQFANVTCNGLDNGSVSVNITTGGGGYTYTWDVPAGQAPIPNTESNPTGLTTGVYNVTVTDANNCEATFTETITEPTIVSATLTPTATECFGEANGSAIAVGSGGSGSGYLFNWTCSGEVTDTPSSLPPGNCTVIVTDGSGCSESIDVVIPDAPELIVALDGTPTNLTCFENGTGAIALNASGGTGTLTYTWSDGTIPNTTEDPTGLDAGIYSVTVEDANGCDEEILNIEITQPDAVGIDIVTNDDASCSLANGSVSVLMTGGTGTATYTWSPDLGTGGTHINSVASGTYDLTVSDVNNCEAYETIIVTEPPVMVVDNEMDDMLTCFGGSDGEVSVAISGGTGPGTYEYQWADGFPDAPTVTGLPVGVYDVDIVDDDGCIISAQVEVTEPPQVSATLTPASTNCFGEASGSAVAVGSGGSGSGYTFNWVCSGEITPTPSALPPGNCTVIVSDGLGCSESLSIVVPEAPELIVALDGTPTNLTCYDDGTGAITLDANGGTGALTYTWSDGTIPNTTQDPTGLDAGTYSVTVADANGCDEEILNIEITQPDSVEIVVVTNDDASCMLANGSLGVQVNGGTGTPTYTWSPNIGSVATYTNSIASGTYDLTVSDANGCEEFETIIVTEPPVMVIDNEVDAMLTCFGNSDGVVSVEVSGGTGPGTYEYQWVDGFPDAPTVTGLPVGVYDVNIVDGDGCTIPAQVEVTEPPQVSATLTPAATNCFGEATGTAVAVGSGGSGSGYTFNWTCSGETTDSPVALPAGNCTVIVTDGMGCSESLSVVVPEAPELIATLDGTPTNLTCFENGTGAIALNSSGGTGTLTYTWSDPTIPNTTEDPSGLAAGTYAVTVSDANGCDEEILNIMVTQPDDVAINVLTNDDASCNLANGSISVEVTGGTGTPTYTWSPNIGSVATYTNSVASGTYNLTVTDVNGCEEFETIIVDEPDALAIDNEVDDLLDCNGASDGVVSVEISGGTGPGTYEYQWADGFPDAPTVTGLPVGVYNVDIVDGNGCIIPAQVEVTEPSPMAITLDNFTNPDCQDPNGTINISVNGGTVTTGYSFNWNNGDFNTEDLVDLPTGSYNVIVTDNNGCEATETFSIAAPGVFDIDPVIESDISCFGVDDGTITVTTSNGTGPFSYTWSDPSIGDISNPTGLAPGFYSTTITDLGTGCENFIAPVEITQPDIIDLTTSAATAATCLNNNGSIDAIVLGGTGIPTYSWTGPNSFTAATEDINGLSEGSYTLVITDQNNCMGSVTVDVDVPTPPTLATVPTMANCNAASTGSILATPSNPNGSVSYAWSPNVAAGTMDMATGLLAGTYTVTITDDLDCTAESGNVVITEPTAIDIQFGTTDAACGAMTGTIDLMVSGGTVAGDYSYSWDQGLPNTQDQSAVGQGDYTVTVTDDNGCEAIQLVQVTQPNAAVIVPATTNVTCFEGTNGAITIGVTGGNNTNGYSFLWDGTGPITDPTLQNQSGLSAGTYAVTVFDSDNCATSVQNIDITEGNEITVSATTDDAECGNNNGAINLIPSGGAGGFIFDWTDVALPDVANPMGLGPGNYEVLITDQLGCTFTNFYLVENPDGVELDTASTQPLCTGDPTGSASIVLLNVDPNDVVITWDSGPTSVPVGTLNPDNLLAGTYTGNIEDALGCITPFFFNIADPDAVLGTALSPTSSVSCFGDSDASASIQALGGTGNYDYLWSTDEVTESIGGLAAGTYTVTVTDSNGCTDVPDAIVISEPPLLELAATPTDLVCNGQDDGTINLVATGGNSNYQYDWNFNQYDGLSELTGLAPGTYEVVVTDIEGCNESLSVQIDEPDAIDLQVEAISEFEFFNVSCNGYTDGFISVAVAGGTGGSYDYLWSDGSTDQTLSDIGAGTYSVVVTDSNGCDNTIEQELVEPPAIEVESEAIDVRCFGDDNGALVVTNTQGGAGPYVYGLDGSPLGTGIFNGLPAGTYELTTQDANGCEMVAEINIEEPNPLEVLLDANKPILPEGHIEIEFGDSVTLTPDVFLGGAPLQLLQWDNEAFLCPLGNCASINVKPITTTNYRVTVVDENGCVHDDNIEVRVLKPRNVYIPNVFSPDSDNLENNVFQVYTGRGVTSIEEFIVVDRWGEVVFRADGPFDPNLLSTTQWGWDGTLNGKVMNPAVFVYYARVQFLDGEEIDYSGDVTLLR